MKKVRLTLLLAAAASMLMLAACSGNEPSQEGSSASASSSSEAASSSSASSEDGRSAAEISEAAMDNFLAKVEEGNYVIESAGFLKTTVASEDQVTFEYAEDMYNDFAVMSVNNEVFQAFFDEEGMKDAAFIGEGTAMDMASSRLLSYWLDPAVSDGNIYNLFYNTQENPLSFVSYEPIVKKTVGALAGYGDSTLKLMHEVYLTLDAEDPTSAHITAEMDDDVVARIFPDDIDIIVTFGNAETNALADAWMTSPVYPEAPTQWSDGDYFVFNSVFIQPYGYDALPFPSFASYAFLIDGENFVWDDQVSIRDSHATQEDIDAYLALLESEGFEKAEETGEDGLTQTWYRKLIRPKYNCYVSVNVKYNNGADLIARKWYDMASYDTLEDINAVLSENGYPVLPESEAISEVSALDHADEATEGWLYFFTYDTVLYTDMAFADDDAARAYVEQYKEALADAGFTLEANDEPEVEEEESHHQLGEDLSEFNFKALKDDVSTDPDERYVSANNYADFRYLMKGDGQVTLRFKAEAYINAEEAKGLISEAGIPAPDLTEPIGCRDLVDFEKARYDKDYKLFFTVSQDYADNAAAEAFLDGYTPVLEDAGFLPVSPGNVGTLKNFAWYNEETGQAVCFDFFPSDTHPQIYFEFIAE